MRVLHVVRGLANSSGTTHIVVPLSEELARQGCDVTVFYVDKANQYAIEPNLSLVESRCFPLSLPFPNPGISLSFARALKEKIRDFDFVHIHAVWNFPTFCAMRAALKAQVPYMVAPQGSFEPWALRQNYWGKKIYGRLTEIPLLQRATYLQALTEKEAQQFRRCGIDTPTVIIPNGVNLGVFERNPTRLTQRLGLSPDQKIFLFLSRLHPKKGLDVLLSAFAQLLLARNGVTLVLAGHDAGTGYRETVKQLIANHRIESNCMLLGEVNGEEKYDVLLGADAFVLPSYSEGLPLAVLEAMGAALPVVISHDCNVPEVEAWKAGYVVDQDPTKVCEALQGVVDNMDQARLMGQNGRRLVKEKFSWQEIAKHTKQLYEHAAAGAAQD